MLDDFFDPLTGLKSIISLDTQSAFSHTLPSKIIEKNRIQKGIGRFLILPQRRDQNSEASQKILK
jgi:hypothetical protein